MEYKSTLDKLISLTEILDRYTLNKTPEDFEEEFGCKIIWSALTINIDLYPDAPFYNYVKELQFKSDAAKTYFVLQYGF